MFPVSRPTNLLSALVFRGGGFAHGIIAGGVGVTLFGEEGGRGSGISLLESVVIPHFSPLTTSRRRLLTFQVESSR